MSVAIGSTVAHFKILSKIGAGGMGEVYRATDTKLGREVAFKLLPEAMASDPERLSRFQREARTVAALNHPNIVTIHSVDEADGIHFLTMELVAGKQLSELIPPGGFSLDRLFALAIPIADAVASAHSSGIVHRDLKPENVMVDDLGRVKVLDFGLAKVAEGPIRADGATETMPLTEDGRVMGTVPYMSPEQVQGRPVDARSDIFSLGVMLYEMVAGRRPFAGDSSAEVMAAIQRDDAETLTAVRSDLPRHLGRIVQHCLEKEPDRRYQSALDVRNELEQLQREVGSEAPAVGVTPATVPPAGVLPADSGLVLKTLLVTDLVASTRLVEELGDERAAEVMASHDRLVRDLVATCGGREIDKTDGFLLLFDRPVDAVRFAVLYHRRLANLGRDEGLELGARAGIHVGEVVLRENPPADVARGAKPLEVEGLAKPAAARLMSLAQGGQTLLSQGAFDLARRAAVGGAEEIRELRWQSHGMYRLKGVEEPMAVFEVGEDELAPLGPPPSSDKVIRLASGEPSTASATSAEAPRRSDARTWWLAAAAVALLALALALALGYRPEPAPVRAPEPAVTAADPLLWEISPLSIAVLPFDNLSPDPENAFFTDGMTEEIISRLSQIGAMTVVSRTSVMRYKETEKNAQEIGQELHVANILEGSVRRAGGQVRITGQLIDTASDRHLWSQSYQRRLDDVFAVQTEVAEQIASALEVELSPGERGVFSKRPTASFSAYDLYLEGLSYFERDTKHDNEKAIELWGQALAKDPEFALAVARRANAYFNRASRHGFPHDEWMEASFREAQRAVALDPELAEARNALGNAYSGKGFRLKAVESYLKALELKPNYASAVSNLGGNHWSLGQYVEALFTYKKAVSLEPSSSNKHARVGSTFSNLAMDDEAKQWFDRAIELSPHARFARTLLAWHWLLRGREDLALELAEEILAVSPEAPQGLTLVGTHHWLAGNDLEAEKFFRSNVDGNRLPLAQIAWKNGRREEAEALLAPRLERYESRLQQGTATHSTYMGLARIHALRGEEEEAYRRLEQSLDAGYINYRWLLREPLFEKIRDETRFLELVSRIEARVDRLRRQVEAREAAA